MMPDVDEIVKGGHMLLAQRTETLAEQSPVERALRAAGVFKALREIVTTGDPLVGKGAVRAAMLIVQGGMPADKQPRSSYECIGLATSAIRAHHGIASVDELFERAKIAECAVTLGQSGMMYLGPGRRKLFFKYDSSEPALSTLVNIHELHHVLLPEQDRVYRILEELVDVPGYKQLTPRLHRDPALKARWVATAMASNQFNFLKSPDILAMMDEPLRQHVQERAGEMNVLECYTHGSSYVTQSDIVGKAPDLQDTPAAKMYALLGQLDAIAASTQAPKQQVYRVGVGLAEYVRAHPSEERLLREKGFQQRLTARYFPDGA